MWVDTRFFIIQHLPFKVKLKKSLIYTFDNILTMYDTHSQLFFEKQKLPVPPKKEFMIESNESGGL